MRRILTILFAASVALATASTTFAQAAIAGVVKDASGGALRGVTVEADSPVLIEKARTAVTDNNGQYKIIDLRPGTYRVTFFLPRFNSVVRENVELAGSATTTVNSEMQIGEVQESITVSADTPIVDVQSTLKQNVLGHELIEKVPSGRQYSNLGVLVPGVVASQGTGAMSGQDVGGASGDNMVSLTTHGSKFVDMRIMNNGVVTATLQAGGGIGMATPNPNAAREITIDSGSVSPELSTGGPRINYIPRDGGNTFQGTAFFSGTSNGLQGDNFTADLKSRGLQAVDQIKSIWDVNPGFGGPLAKDSLWFWYTGRWNHADNYVGGMFYNLNANNPNAFTYAADPSHQAVNNIHQTDNQLRVTWQVTARNKIAGTYDQQDRCNCPFYVSAVRAPEAGVDRVSPTQRLIHAEWSSPITNRLLAEAVWLYRTEIWGNTPPALEGFASGTAPGNISVTEQSTGLTYRGWTTYNRTSVPNFFWRAAVSYVTGAHDLKVGYNDVNGDLEQTTFNFQPTAYRFNGGSPNQITQFATPITASSHEDHDFGLYAQDKMTWGWSTLIIGGRFDWFASHFPEQTLSAAPLAPGRSIAFPAQDNLNWKDFSPRLGYVRDLFGDGRTAVRVSLNKYLQGQGLNALGSDPNPVNAAGVQATRAWNDANKNFVPDCDLTNTQANGECQALTGGAGANFGKTVPVQTFDKDLLTGWNHRNYNWEFSTGIQRAIAPRLSVDVAYFRRVYGNFRVTDNLLVSPSDYAAYSLVAPTDPQLGTVSGSTITGLYDLNANKIGQVQNLNTLADRYGEAIDHWNGFDVSVVSRMSNGLLFQGGLSAGKEVTDMCAVVSKLPEMLVGLPVASSIGTVTTTNVLQPASQCHMEEPMMTQVKLVGAYTLPGVGVQVSGTFQSIPGAPMVANFVATNPYLAANSTLGRSLSGGAANVTVNLVQPGTVYLDRVNQLDLRFGKTLRFGRVRSVVNLDLFNALNGSGVLQANQTFNTGSWLTPQSVLTARFVKLGFQVDF